MSSRTVLAVLSIATVVAACTPDATSPTTTTAAIDGSIATTTTEPVDGPEILSVEEATTDFSTYQKAELVVDVDADYSNPFDQREVSLDASFTGPDGSTLSVPGFWDADDAWRIRFTPDAAGAWNYTITIRDHRGSSNAVDGSFDVDGSDHKGFLRIGSDVDPGLSPRYFAYEDGTPWYGRGHADLGMGFGGAATDGSGLRKMQQMIEAGENYEMWWPLWANNFIQNSYDDYALGPMQVIDYVVQQAEEKDIALVFTVWGHQFLRTGAHDWPDDRWRFNGFSHLVDDIADFFVDDEAWAWQENLYRYIVARWSYSPAIVMWQTITEINGTESYDQTDPWHERVNAWFQENDPFDHPTTATGSGNYDWPTGHAVMDVAQVHLYEVFVKDPVTDAATVAEWTRRMFDRVEKPNWVGEYGVRGQQHYPEMMHYSNWAALSAGSAMTPIEWNDGNAYNSFDEAMADDMRRFAAFVDEVPLVEMNPEAVDVATADPDTRAWGVVGQGGGVVWIQDASLEGESLDVQREGRTVTGDFLSIALPHDGPWIVRPYDTWTGEWLADATYTCGASEGCVIPLPDYHRDIALAIYDSR